MTNRKHSLIIQPGDSFFPIVHAMDSARTSINITIFRMDDPVIQQAMLDATKRGVRVRALIAANPRGWEKKNRKLLKDLEKAGIETRQPAADTRKTRFHYKILVVDNATSLILTFNPTRENLHYTRDYGVIVRDETIAAELNRLFDADWDDREFRPTKESPLVISPYNSREKMGELLQNATKSIHISDAKLRDYQILNLLMAKARAGIEVKILGSDRYYSDVFSLLKFRQITRFKMHAKCVVVDSARAFVGSMNLRFENMDKRREVGIVVDDPTVVAKLEDIFASDWTHKQATSREAATTLLKARTPSVSGILAPPPEERFVLLSRRDALSRYPLRNGVTTIGRSDENDVVVSDTVVGRFHARVRVTDDAVLAADLDTKNGTFVNGNQIAGEVAIKPGDIVSIADADEFRLVEI
jgi:cardiolipin synthase A/B